MDNKNGQNGKRNGNPNNPLIVAVLGGLLGSTGSLAIYVGTPIGQELARPDPFTGTQAAALEQRVVHLEDEVIDHIERHPDVTNHFDRRITTLEVQYAAILSNQEKILSRLERL
jgi:hypothetical protein